MRAAVGEVLVPLGASPGDVPAGGHGDAPAAQSCPADRWAGTRLCPRATAGALASGPSLPSAFHLGFTFPVRV